jgi:hypothetical protein
MKRLRIIDVNGQPTGEALTPGEVVERVFADVPGFRSTVDLAAALFFGTDLEVSAAAHRFIAEHAPETFERQPDDDETDVR